MVWMMGWTQWSTTVARSSAARMTTRAPPATLSLRSNLGRRRQAAFLTAGHRCLGMAPASNNGG